ncbi:MAG: tetratricopeptide repeat protein [Acidobacteriota bacterium]|nr:tetratricopeptide repeat protein [Acidobacteriota bacterium]MDH3522400.1 tetratricopeptide repeat protein [Acidobacteriota bacterium]
MRKSRRASPPASAAQMPLRRKLAFSAVAFVLFFVLAEGILWLAGVDTLLVEEDPYVGFQGSIRLFEPTPDGAALRTAANKRALFNDQRFSRTKGFGTYRIFAVGGSTTYGRPFADSTSFAGWLRAYLEAVAPQRRWEVVNAGGISYASYRVATLMEELAGYDPDLFVVYSGNNEFLEKRTYEGLIAEPVALTRARLLLQHSRLWAVGRRALRAREAAARRRYQMTGEVKELLDDSAGLEYYHRDDEFTRRVIEHYRFNLQRMINLARSAGAQVLLVTIPVNERDFSPFKSQFSDGLPEAARRSIEDLLAAARAAQAAGDAAAAARAAGEAVALDPRYAESHFALGRALSELGDDEAARDALRRALEEDVCPLRALPAINEAIRELAAANAVPLVDFERRLAESARARSGKGSPGAESFLDHVHPTIEVNGLLAAELLGALEGLGVVAPPADWRERISPAVAAAIEGRIGPEERAEALKNLSKVLLWAGKTEEAGRFAAEAAETLEDDWEVHYNAGVVALDGGDLEAARRELEEAARLEPESARVHDQLGSLFARLGDAAGAVAAGERAVELAPRMAGAWNNLSSSYKDAGRPAEALAAARQAVEIEPDFAEAHNNLGNARLALGDLEGAVASYARATRLRPGFAEAFANQGLALAGLGRLEDSQRAFAEAVRLDAGLAAAWLDLAFLQLENGQPAAGLATLRRAVAAVPDDDRLRYGLGRALILGNELAAARASLERALELNPRNALAANDLAALCEHLGEPERALELYRQAARLDPALSQARANAERLAASLGKGDPGA